MPGRGFPIVYPLALIIVLLTTLCLQCVQYSVAEPLRLDPIELQQLPHSKVAHLMVTPTNFDGHQFLCNHEPIEVGAFCPVENYPLVHDERADRMFVADHE